MHGPVKILEKYVPQLGFEPRIPALCASALTNARSPGFSLEYISLKLHELCSHSTIKSF